MSNTKVWNYIWPKDSAVRRLFQNAEYNIDTVSSSFDALDSYCSEIPPKIEDWTGVANTELQQMPYTVSTSEERVCEIIVNADEELRNDAIGRFHDETIDPLDGYPKGPSLKWDGYKEDIWNGMLRTNYGPDGIYTKWVAAESYVNQHVRGWHNSQTGAGYGQTFRNTVSAELAAGWEETFDNYYSPVQTRWRQEFHTNYQTNVDYWIRTRLGAVSGNSVSILDGWKKNLETPANNGVADIRNVVNSHNTDIRSTTVNGTINGINVDSINNTVKNYIGTTAWNYGRQYSSIDTMNDVVKSYIGNTAWGQRVTVNNINQVWDKTYDKLDTGFYVNKTTGQVIAMRG